MKTFFQAATERSTMATYGAAPPFRHGLPTVPARPKSQDRSPTTQIPKSPLAQEHPLHLR
jgi:hypothetical protein